YNRTKEAYNWFIENLMTVSPDNPRLQELSINLLNDNNTKDLIRNAMIRADVGIEEINARIIKFNYDQLPSDIPENLKKLMAEPDVTWMTPEIKTIHKGVSFDFSEESEGTIRVFDIIGCWIKALKDGKVLVVDELEIKLHPHLCSYLVTLFHDSSQNKNNAQLIFSTHNVYLLEQDIFRRDQIWFTEKIPETGQTDLYSLWEFSPRKDKNLKIGYLTGRYGALPFIQNKGLIS
ncbi:MAG: AAA family ATPase, partial [Candidatus Thermoplasmatota archaeon]|nr:AAA family ATPase [Candidatus Thermoplasmatota archaeon]